MRIRWGGTIAFAATELRVQLHETLALATSMIVQVVLLLFVWILNRPLLPYALLGSVIYSVFMLGQRVQNEAAYIRIESKLHELYHASPLGPEAYFVGMSVGILLAYLPPILILVAVLFLAVPVVPLAGVVLLAVAAAVWVFTSSMGYIISTLFKENRAIWPYASIITNLFGVLPPVLYPLRFLPAAARPWALLVPTSSAVALVEAAQGGLVALPVPEVLIAAASLGIEAALLFLLALLWARRSAREA
ncbi:MAG: ABC transporter permease [Thermoplasmata archaeon]